MLHNYPSGLQLIPSSCEAVTCCHDAINNVSRSVAVKQPRCHDVMQQYILPVSYTHLTLPTILLV